MGHGADGGSMPRAQPTADELMAETKNIDIRNIPSHLYSPETSVLREVTTPSPPLTKSLTVGQVAQNNETAPLEQVRGSLA